MEFPHNKEFRKISYINNRNSKNEKDIPNPKLYDSNNNKNNHILTKSNINNKIPNPLLNQNILNKNAATKNKIIKLNNKDLLIRAVSYKTLENNESKDKIHINSSRHSINKKANDSNSSANIKSKKILNEHKITNDIFVKDLNNTEVNQMFTNGENINSQRDIKLNNNNTKDFNLKNIVTLLTSKNKILKRNTIQNIKNVNAFNKNSNNSNYNTKRLTKYNYSSIASSNYSSANSSIKNKYIKEKLKLENQYNSNVHKNFPGKLNQKSHINFDNIDIKTINNYTDRNYQTNKPKKVINFNKNKKIGVFKNCRSQKYQNFDNITNTISDIDSSRSNYYKNTNVNNSINNNIINKIKPQIKSNESSYLKNTIFDNNSKNQYFQSNQTSRDKIENLKYNSLSKREIVDSKINNDIQEFKLSNIKNMKKILFNNKLNHLKTKKMLKKEKILSLTNGNNSLNSVTNLKSKINSKYIPNIGNNTSRFSKKNINFHKIYNNKSNINYNSNIENNEKFASYKNLNESTNISFIKKLENKVNYLNINLNNWNSINNTTICNNNQNNTQNIMIPPHINTFNDNSIFFKKKLKNKFLKKQNNTYSNKSLINSNNNIIILNNISMNNLNNISFEYLSKVNKKKNNYNSYKNFDTIQKRLNNYISKEKNYNVIERNKELEKKREYYNNQKKLHNKKNTYKQNNRIKEQSLNGCNLKQIKKIKNKNDFINKIRTIRHNKMNSSTIFNHKIKQNIPNEHIPKNNISNNYNNMIYTNKINQNVANILNQNHSTFYNPQLDNIMKNIKEKIHKGEKAKINSQQISPKKIQNMFYYTKNINSINPIKKFRNSHKLKNKIKKHNNRKKSIVTEFNNYFKIKKRIQKNCLTDLNEKTIEEIKNYKKDSISIHGDNTKEYNTFKNSLKSFSIDKTKHQNQKIKIKKKKKQKYLNILNSIKENNDKNPNSIKRATEDNFIPTEIDNINKNINDDGKILNLQMAEEYTTDIIESLLMEEDYYCNKKKYINPFYLENEESELTPEMRTIAVDWLVLIHFKIFKFDENTLFLTIQIFDRYLTKVDLSTEKTELLLYTSFMLASKHNEIDYVNMQETLKLSQDKFTKEQIIKMESEILNKLDFEILAPTMYEFFILFASYINLKQNIINQGLYLLNIILVDYHMLKYPNFILAFAVIKIITKKVDKNLEALIENILKNNKLDNFIKMFNKEGYEKVCKKIELLYNTFIETKYKNIQEKFAEEEYNCVSKFFNI